MSLELQNKIVTLHLKKGTIKDAKVLAQNGNFLACLVGDETRLFNLDYLIEITIQKNKPQQQLKVGGTETTVEAPFELDLDDNDFAIGGDELKKGANEIPKQPSEKFRLDEMRGNSRVDFSVDSSFGVGGVV